MEERDVVVVGAGISGLAFAWHAARSGARPLVLESSDRAGGCLDSRQGAPGYWFELGAHTLYNSYGGLLEVAEGCATPPTYVPRAPARKRFGLLRDGQLTTMGPLSVLARFGFWELVTHVPRALFASKEGKSTQDYYGRLVGPRNYQSVLAPFLAAVPSQDVGGFPAGGAGSLFKTRARRKEVPRSFTFDGGVGAVAAAIVASGVEVAPKSPIVELRRRGAGFEIRLEDGRRIGAPVVALAVDAATAARLLGPDHPELAGVLARVGMVSLDSVGVVVRKEEVALPELAFVVPIHDLFWSVVTRDPVPDATWRAFTFHFRPGHDRDARLRRVEEVLGTRATVHMAERSTVLPSPALGHGNLVADVDRLLAGTRLALTGNYFAGLAIEDCVLRAKAEWARVAPPRA